MNINLTPKLQDYVQQKVAAGNYNNVSEVVREALRLMEERDSERAAKLAWLRQAIQEGLNSPVEPLEDIETLLSMARTERDAKRTAQQRS